LAIIQERVGKFSKYQEILETVVRQKELGASSEEKYELLNREGTHTIVSELKGPPMLTLSDPNPR